MTLWRNMTERVEGKAPVGAGRSPRWRSFRDQLLAGQCCQVCDGKTHLIAHHMVPFHIAPDLELVRENIVILCEAKRYGVNCHLMLGHLGNWRRTNVSVLADVAYWHQRLKLDAKRSR